MSPKFQPNVPDEDNDDIPVGRVLSRREMLALLGTASAAMLFGGGIRQVASQSQATPPATGAATALPGCVVRPEMTEGPYFVDQQLNRSDIRIDPADGSVKPGVPLSLIFNVSSVAANACTPLEGAQVDIWHCDALGVYSGVTDRSFDTTGQKWLRGYQVTDKNGVAQFLTIYPGWYSGRTVHIHFKIRTKSTTNSAYEFTSQLFFPESVSDEVYKKQPYSTHPNRDTLNARDSIYSNGGDQLLLTPNEVGTATPLPTAAATAAAFQTAVATANGGYQAIFNIGLDLSDTAVGQSDAAGGGGVPGGNPGGQPPNGTRPATTRP
jgi:protocatechuate 3,4-dioxygenase beta subunit